MKSTKQEREYMGLVAELGCCVCLKSGYETAAEVHHVGNGTMGKRASNYDVIPLCHIHHRNGGHGVAIHSGRKEWEKNHGKELDFLAEVKSILCE